MRLRQNSKLGNTPLNSTYPTSRCIDKGWGKLPKPDVFRPSYEHQNTPAVTRMQAHEHGKVGSVLERAQPRHCTNTCCSRLVLNAVGSVSSKNDYSFHVQYEVQEATQDLIGKGMCTWVVSALTISAIFPRWGLQQRKNLVQENCWSAEAGHTSGF